MPSVPFSTDLRRQRLENLRSLRKGKVVTDNLNDAIDYRYRGNPSETPFHTKEIKELWGNAALDAENERQKKDVNRNKINFKKSIELEKDRSKFVSFFDGVDAKMKNNKQQSSKSRMTYERSRRGDDVTGDMGSNFNNLLDDILKGDSKPLYSDPIERMDTTRSIFDLFPLKSRVVNPNKYDKHAFELYHEAMKSVVESDRFGRKATKKPVGTDIMEQVISWLLKDEKVLDYEYPALKNADKFGIAIDQNDSDGSKQMNGRKKLCKDFRSEIYIPGTETSNFYAQLKKQNENFRQKVKFSDEHFILVERAFKNLASRCAKNARSAPLTIAWEKMKEAGIIPSNDTLNVCLYVTSTVTSGILSSALSGGLSSKGNRRQLSAVMSILGKDNDGNKEIEDEKVLETIDFPTELALFHDLLYKPTEKSVSLRVKRLVSVGDATGAEHLLDSFPVSFASVTFAVAL
jgi:hypothetical protein